MNRPRVTAAEKQEESGMKTWVRGPALTLAGAAAIATAYVGWSGSQAIEAARSRPQAIVGAVAFAPEATLAGPAAPEPLVAPDPRVSSFAPCARDDCSAAAPAVIAADDILYGIEPVSEGEPWIDIADAGFGATLSVIHDELSGLSLSSAESGSMAAPAPEISTAAMVALGVVLLTARRAGRNRWASWKAPWRAFAVAAST
jgi:hypothetical protein